jgi:hypothetical protein
MEGANPCYHENDSTTRPFSLCLRWAAASNSTRLADLIAASSTTFQPSMKSGCFNLLAPNLLTLLAKNNVRFLWLYERRCVKSRQWRWITRRYLLDIQALVQWLVTSRALGHPYYCVDDRGDAWLLVPAHLLERRRYTRHGGKIGGAR